MTSERARMLSGALYDAADPELVAARLRARALCQRFNALDPSDDTGVAEVLATLFGAPVDATITPPFFCDYGVNIRLGARVYFNFNCVVLDVARVTIGDNTLFGPGVHLYTALHPMSAVQRRTGLELAKPVEIGPDAWIGGNTVVCPGVTIGARSVIGAGSVVTRSLSADVFAAGNPCRVVRRLTAGADG